MPEFPQENRLGAWLEPPNRGLACPRGREYVRATLRHRRVTFVALLLAILQVAPAVPSASPVTGTYVGVKDGDSIILFVGGLETEVRLDRIDAPERGQPFSTRAKEALTALASGKTLRIEDRGRDHYGRLLARVYAGEIELNLRLVESGLAWHFVKYSDDSVLASAEAEARRLKRGLWADPHPEAPWDYRERDHPRALSEVSALLSAGTGAPLHGNTSSRVFHLPSCINYSCSSCVRNFTTAEEAVAAGYRPGHCCAAKKTARP